MLEVSARPITRREERPRYQVRFANTPGEILEAQRLRYRVFAEEYGARLITREPGVDHDHFDAYCKHLVVLEENSGRVVGTYRVLTPDAARAVGSYYSEDEFYLTRLDGLRSGLVELGRSCIDAEHRSGAVITLLWGALAQFMLENGYAYLIGCASVSMRDGGHNAANLFLKIGQDHMAPVEYRAMPRNPFPYEKLANGAEAVVPPLLKGYLRAGAWICGEPAWDPDFNSADLMILLPMARIADRYQKHFLRG